MLVQSFGTHWKNKAALVYKRFPSFTHHFLSEKKWYKKNSTLFLGLGGENKMVEETLAILVRKTEICWQDKVSPSPTILVCPPAQHLTLASAPWHLVRGGEGRTTLPLACLGQGLRCFPPNPGRTKLFAQQHALSWPRGYKTRTWRETEATPQRVGGLFLRLHNISSSPSQF